MSTEKTTDVSNDGNEERINLGPLMEKDAFEYYKLPDPNRLRAPFRGYQPMRRFQGIRRVLVMANDNKPVAPFTLDEVRSMVHEDNEVRPCLRCENDFQLVAAVGIRDLRDEMVRDEILSGKGRGADEKVFGRLAPFIDTREGAGGLIQPVIAGSLLMANKPDENEDFGISAHCGSFWFFNKISGETVSNAKSHLVIAQREMAKLFDAKDDMVQSFSTVSVEWTIARRKEKHARNVERSQKRREEEREEHSTYSDILAARYADQLGGSQKAAFQGSRRRRGSN